MWRDEDLYSISSGATKVPTRDEKLQNMRRTRFLVVTTERALSLRRARYVTSSTMRSVRAYLFALVAIACAVLANANLEVRLVPHFSLLPRASPS
jgi:hypothetical protein